jgi:hypothetical protein
MFHLGFWAVLGAGCETSWNAGTTILELTQASLTTTLGISIWDPSLPGAVTTSTGILKVASIAMSNSLPLHRRQSKSPTGQFDAFKLPGPYDPALSWRWAPIPGRRRHPGRPGTVLRPLPAPAPNFLNPVLSCPEPQCRASLPVISAAEIAKEITGSADNSAQTARTTARGRLARYHESHISSITLPMITHARAAQKTGYGCGKSIPRKIRGIEPREQNPWNRCVRPTTTAKR